MAKDQHRFHRNKIVNNVVLPSKNPDLFMDMYDIRLMKCQFMKHLNIKPQQRRETSAFADNNSDSDKSLEEDKSNVADMKMVTEEDFLHSHSMGAASLSKMIRINELSDEDTGSDTEMGFRLTDYEPNFNHFPSITRANNAEGTIMEKGYFEQPNSKKTLMKKRHTVEPEFEEVHKALAQPQHLGINDSMISSKDRSASEALSVAS